MTLSFTLTSLYPPVVLWGSYRDREDCEDCVVCADLGMAQPLPTASAITTRVTARRSRLIVGPPMFSFRQFGTIRGWAGFARLRRGMFRAPYLLPSNRLFPPAAGAATGTATGP